MLDLSSKEHSTLKFALAHVGRTAQEAPGTGLMSYSVVVSSVKLNVINLTLCSLHSRFERDSVIAGKPWNGQDRHNGEIAAFHLNR